MNQFKALLGALLLTLLTTLPSLAQEMFLPVTTSSEEARNLYTEALEASMNFKMPVFIEKMTQAIEKDPNFFMAYVHSSRMAGFAGNEEVATAMMEKAIAVTGDLNEAEQILKKIMITMKADKDADVSGMMTEIADRNPNVLEAQVMASWTKMGNKDAAGAVAYMEKASTLFPNYAPVYNMVGYAKMDNGDMTGAEAAFDKYIELLPNEGNPYDSKGDFYMQNKQFDKAAAAYKKAYEMDNTFTQSLEKAKKAEAAAKK